MFLTEANVLHYLRMRRFVNLDVVVSGDYAVRNLSRRNRNYHVTCGAREYLVKQAKQWDRGGRASIEREARLCLSAKSDPRFELLRRLTPQSYSYDPQDSTLIFEFLSGDARAERADAAAAARLGRTMAEFHRQMRRPDLRETVPEELPGYFEMHRWSPATAADRSEGQLELLRLVQRHDFAPALDAARAGWRAEALIHGDWKLENCLVSADGGVHIIDWELASWGDPLWDLATLLQSYWNRWLMSPDRHPVEQLGPSWCSLLRSYGEVAGAIDRERLMRFAAVRMLQSAWESLPRARQLEPAALRLSQASLNILARPDWAAAQFLDAHA